MSERTHRADLANNSGAYVLNALDTNEKTEFEAQLAGSEELRNEVTELMDTAVLLGMAVTPVAPSAGLKDSIMSQLDATPQLSRDVAPVRTLRAVPAHLATEEPPAALSSTKSQVRWFQRPMMVAAAAVAAVLIVTGGAYGINAAQNGIQQSNQASALVAIQSAADYQHAAGTVSTGGKATLVWSLHLGKSALIVKGLKSLNDDKTYELWYIDSVGHATPAGLFEASGSNTWRVLDGTMSKGDTIGVTVEPSGGSKAPTTKPVVAIASA